MLAVMTWGETAAFCSLAFAVLMALLTAAIVWGKTTERQRSMAEDLKRLREEIACAKAKGRRAIGLSIYQGRVISRLARRMRLPVDEQRLIRGSEQQRRARRAGRNGAGCTDTTDTE